MLSRRRYASKFFGSDDLTACNNFSAELDRFHLKNVMIAAMTICVIRDLRGKISIYEAYGNIRVNVCVSRNLKHAPEHT